jgi:dCMP deaminase
MKVVIAYVPVLHEGYYKFFMEHGDADILYVLGSSLIEGFRPLVKDIRALDPKIIASVVKAFGIFPKVLVLEENQIRTVVEGQQTIVMPDEEECHEIAERYFSGIEVVFDPVFLRWDKRNSVSKDPVSPARVVSVEEVDREMIRLASVEAKRSIDWWRQVGALVAKDGVPLIGAICNKHVPTRHALMVFGDPRGNFTRGVNLEISTVLHSEAAVIAWAARSPDISLLDADLYVTTFPCPPCAKLIAYSGIKRLFYADGYAVLDGQDILENQGVEIIQVKI